MGRIKTKYINSVTKTIFKMYKDKIKDNFEDNKKFLDENIMYRSKKIRNQIAGYLTRLKKKNEFVQ